MSHHKSCITIVISLQFQPIYICYTMICFKVLLLKLSLKLYFLIASKNLDSICRIIVCSNNLNSCIFPDSAGVYRYGLICHRERSWTISVLSMCSIQSHSKYTFSHVVCCPRFDEEFSLDESTTLQVSDHYPVYCSLKPRIHTKIVKNIISKHAILIIDKVNHNLSIN